MTVARERESLRKIAAQYRALGYEVVEEPGAADVPAFLGDYRPDLVARSATDNVVVEVKHGNQFAHGERLRPIAELFVGRPGWRFSLVVVRDEEVPDVRVSLTPVLTIDDVRDRTRRAEALSASPNRDAAFLLLWTSLEALLRRIAERGNLPLATSSTSVLIRELYSAGELELAQYERAMKAIRTRNALVHGLAATIGGEETKELAGLVHELLDELSSAA